MAGGLTQPNTNPQLGNVLDEDEMKRQLAERQGLGRPSLQPGPVEYGPRAQPTPESTLQPTPRRSQQAQGQAAPPIQPTLDKPSPDKVDPGVGRKIANISREAIDSATDKDKKEINDELEKNLGGPGKLEEAYKQAIERLGGEKIFDRKMKRSDWGLFLMDFGMRLMIASADAEQGFAGLGGAVGEAGVGALGALGDRNAATQGAYDDYNESLRGEAMTFAKSKVERGDEQDKAALDRDIVWTDRGAVNRTTGKPIFHAGGKEQMQPGMAPGGQNRPFASTVDLEFLTQSGMNPNVAKQVAAGGSPSPARIRETARQEWAAMVEKGSFADLWSPIEKRMKPMEQFSQVEKQAWIEMQVETVYGKTKAQSEDNRPSNW